MKSLCLKIASAIAGCVFVAAAEVSITGTVKNGSGSGIAGAELYLVNRQDCITVSGADGSFVLTETEVATVRNRVEMVPLRITGSTVHLPAAAAEKPVTLTLYSIHGKKLQGIQRIVPECRMDLLPLPRGCFLLTVIIGPTVYRTVYLSGASTIVADRTAMKRRRGTGASRPETALVADTLVVEKEGYRTGKVPLSGYTEKNVTIVLDTSTVDKPSSGGLTVYFIRHAETVANASGETGGGGPVEDHDTLTELGERQVRELTEYLVGQEIRPDLIAVSPSLRTQKTIQPFLAASGRKAQIWVELNECCGQEPTGEPIPDARPDTRWKMKITLLSDLFACRTDDDCYYWWPESYEEGLFMVMTARDRLMDLFSLSGKTVMLVGHAVNGNLLLGLLRGYDMLTEKPDRSLYLMNAGVQKLTQDTLTGLFTVKQNVNKPATK